MSTITYQQLENEVEALRARLAAVEGGQRSGGVTLGSVRHAKQLLDCVLAQAPIVLWSVDSEGLFTLSEGKGLEVLGLEPGAVLGRSVFDLYGDVPQIASDVWRALSGEEFRSTAEIHGLYFETWYSPIWDGAGEVTGALGVSTVVTERVRAETALQESEDRFYKAFHSSPIAIMISRMETGEFVDVNEAFERMSGFSRGELIGRSAVELNMWVSEGRRSLVVEALKTKGRVRNAEFSFRTKDGAIRIGQISAEVIELEGDDCILSSTRDVTATKEAERALHKLNDELESRVERRTEQLRRSNRHLNQQIEKRKLAHRALRKSEEKWRSLVENVPDIIITVSRDGTIKFANRALSDASKETVVGSSVFDHFCPNQRDPVRKMIESVFETGRAVMYEGPAMGPHGTTAWSSSRIGPVRHKDRVVAAIIVSTDISRRKRAEEEATQRRAELAHVSRVSIIGEMTATLAHELNNPLAAISNFAHGCVRRLLSPQPVDKEDLIDAIKSIAAQATRAAETISSLREFLQKREVSMAEIHPWAVVDDAISLVNAEASRKNVKIDAVADGPLPMVMADAIPMQQVMVNLLLNGMEAMENTLPEQRILRVRAALDKEGWIVISVSDSGTGLPDDYEKSIFEPFCSTKADGLGLGLSISRSIVEAHGGRLWAAPNESQVWAAPNESKGAAFFIRLPVCTRGQAIE